MAEVSVGDSAGSASEEETEQQMYQAMAEKMQADGMDVTASEIEKLVEDQQADDPPAPSEKEEEILEKMAEYQAEYDRQNPAYVVRGALLHCQYGSHCRRLNLPLCHGVYTLKKPIMFKKDCVVEENIPSFGVCSSPDNPTGGSISYVKEAPRNPDGSFTGEVASGTVTGTPCVPVIVNVWDDTHDDTHIGKEGEPALTTRSFLVCKYNGLIEIVRSGQEDED